MLIFTKIFAGITGVILLSMLICGLWVRFSGVKQDAAGMAFHANLGVISVVMSLILVILVIIIKR